MKKRQKYENGSKKQREEDEDREELGIISLSGQAEMQKRKSESDGELGERGNLPKQLRRALITILNKI